MRLIFYILTLIFLAQFYHGQNGDSDVPKNIKGDTTKMYQYKQTSFRKAGLSDLTKSKDTLHIRFSSEIQAIDIWTEDSKAFYGTLLNFTKTYMSVADDRTKKTPEKFFSRTTAIDSAKSKYIYHLFKNAHIFEMPPQDSIADWNSGFDGDIYAIELSTPKLYSYKEYWTPSFYKDRIEEANRIHTICTDLETLLNLNATFFEFIHSLPAGTYRTGGIGVVTTSKAKRTRK